MGRRYAPAVPERLNLAHWNTWGPQVMNAELLAALDKKEDGAAELEASLAAKEEALAALGSAQRVRSGTPVKMHQVPCSTTVRIGRRIHTVISPSLQQDLERTAWPLRAWPG